MGVDSRRDCDTNFDPNLIRLFHKDFLDTELLAEFKEIKNGRKDSQPDSAESRLRSANFGDYSELASAN